ncbi:TY-Chap domain-containing protein [Williamsia sterculiae]|uniref:Uncharacterized protein n=1 Tax=Williamsia sterculiae TaxID=1344003 RepID=A0A1N7HBC2_9NOCA|nr:hypothetical protein [Williamsia sterculiae]SIS22041.1 hypothetical protein SAMN05445060_3876 [Williamsia sterculiae]
MDTDPFDDAVERAWRDFRIRLADRLATLGRGVELRVEQADSGSGPHGVVTFTFTSSRRVRATVDGDDLPTEFDVWAPQVRTLFVAGWKPTNRGVYILGAVRQRADEIAVATVRVFREAWGAVDPAFLTCNDGSDDPLTPRPRPESAFELGVCPQDRDELLGLVLGAMPDILGFDPEVNSVGDISLPTMHVEGRMIVPHTGPAIEFSAVVLGSVSDLTTAGEYLIHQSNRWPDINLCLDHGQVIARMRVTLGVFHHCHLDAAVATWLAFCNDVPMIRRQIKHRTAKGRKKSLNAIHDTLALLLKKAPYGVGLDVEEIAMLCGYDSHAVLQHVKASARRYAHYVKTAKTAGANDDTLEYFAHQREAETWRTLTHSLLAAFHLVRDMEAAPNPPDKTTKHKGTRPSG